MAFLDNLTLEQEREGEVDRYKFTPSQVKPGFVWVEHQSAQGNKFDVWTSARAVQLHDNLRAAGFKPVPS